MYSFTYKSSWNHATRRQRCVQSYNNIKSRSQFSFDLGAYYIALILSTSGQLYYETLLKTGVVSCKVKIQITHRITRIFRSIEMSHYTRIICIQYLLFFVQNMSRDVYVCSNHIRISIYVFVGARY